MLCKNILLSCRVGQKSLAGWGYNIHTHKHTHTFSFRIISFIMSIHKNLFGWAPPRKAQTQANIFQHKHCYNVALSPVKLICVTYKTRYSKPVLSEK